jgi:hypothetical protein
MKNSLFKLKENIKKNEKNIYEEVDEEDVDEYLDEGDYG